MRNIRWDLGNAKQHMQKNLSEKILIQIYFTEINREMSPKILSGYVTV